jgi:tetratricopeptide (TPR) repeat protein
MLAPWARAEGVASRLERVDELLFQWRVSDAAEVAEELYRELPDVPAVQAAAGKVKFHQADYAGAVRLLEKAATAFQGGNARAADAALEGGFLELARRTQEVTRGYRAVDSAHFSFRVKPGKDEVLAPYALEALEAAYERIGGDFQWHPRERIVVEIYGSPAELAAVSTLTEKEIETSGTIAICKFNRLMVTSPRALVHGYGWLDTLAHEYIHLLISQKSRNTVGIWLHEGLAKYSESRWWTEAGQSLDLWQETQLARAVRADKLITFEQMHPSMAKLPSQADTSLAFAEVFTVIEFMHRGGSQCLGKELCPPGVLTGYAASNSILDRMAAGENVEAAIAAVLGTSFDVFKRDWLRYLRARPQRVVPGLTEPRRLEFKKGQRRLDDEDRNLDVDDSAPQEARRFARLGNLLRRAGRPRAAAMEFERAVARAGLAAPVLHNHLASAYLESGDEARALAALKTVEETFPDHAQTHVQLGRIHYRRGHWAAARDAYLKANRQNPFNPEIHAALAEVYARLGDKDRAEVERRAYFKLNRRPWDEERPPETPRPAAAAEEAHLVVETTPWAQLVIDDVDEGLMTPVETTISPGEHVLKLRNPALGIHKVVPITVKPGETVRLKMSLSAP